MTVSGQGFKAGARLLFDGVDGIAVSVVSDATLVVKSPAHAAGRVADSWS